MREASRWPDFLAAVRARIATGASLPEATRAAARHLGGRFTDLDRGRGEHFTKAMSEVRSQRADPLSDRVLTTLAIAAEVGGRHVDSVLAALAVSVGDELRLRRAHDAALTQQRLTAGVALVAPWAMLGLSIATNPTATESYSTPTGTRIIVGGLAATVGGFVLARRSARLSAPPRLFS
jgi:tight adherence protein B